MLPERVRVLLLDLVKPPDPVMAPKRLVFKLTETFVPIESCAPVTASTVTFIPWDSIMLLVTVRCWLAVVNRVEAVNLPSPLPVVLVKVKSPVPSALSLPTSRTALVRTIVPPL